MTTAEGRAYRRSYNGGNVGGMHPPTATAAPAPLTHNDAVAIADALTRVWYENGVQFAGALETVIRRQAGCWDRTAMNPPPENEARHLRLCGWVAAKLGVTAAARDRAGRHLAEMRESPMSRKPTEDDALVVGLDIVVNRTFGLFTTLERIAWTGRLLQAAAAEATATAKTEAEAEEDAAR